MTVQDVLDDIRERPGTGGNFSFQSGHRGADHRVQGLRPEAVNAAVARAKETAESGVWKPAPMSGQGAWRVGELIDQNAAELAELESLNAGMVPAQAQATVSVSSEFFRYYAGWCTKIEGIAADVNTSGLTGVDTHQHAYTLKEPYDVVGLIFPWNGPIFNFCAKLAPSLAAGCSSVVKPAEETPLTALILDRILSEAGVPDGVANLLIGYGHTAGAAITAHPDVEKVAFTGSTEVGRAIVGASGTSNLKKVTLELGGKSPVIIFDDADLNAASTMAAFGTFVHSGQACVCGSRIFAQRDVYEQVVQGIANIANHLQLGGPTEDDQHDRPVDQPEAAHPRPGLPRSGQVRWRRARHRRAPTRPEGVLRAPHRGHQCRPRDEPAVPGGDLRAGGHDPAVRRRGRSRRPGQRQHLRTGGHRLDQGPWPRTPDRQAAQGRNRGAELSAGSSTTPCPSGDTSSPARGYESGKVGTRHLPADEDRSGPDVARWPGRPGNSAAQQPGVQ